MLKPALLMAVWGFAASGARAGIDVEVSSGDHPRAGTPVRLKLPAGFDREAKWKVVRSGTGTELPAQVDGGDLLWIIQKELAAGETRRYRVERGAAAGKEVVVRDIEGKSLDFSYSGRDILRYNYGVIEPPEGYSPIFARSGYIHPVWSPSGLQLSNDFPPHHKHHHGIWFPWTNTVFEGRKVDFWNSAKAEGKVECVRVDSRSAGAVFGSLRARHRFVDLKAPGGPKEVLKETWDVKVYALTENLVFDLRSVQTCAGDSPLELKKYRYGGFGFRGSGQWEGKEGCKYLTSEGKTRKDGHATRARWCAVFGRIGGKIAGAAFLCHKDNFRFPQHMRIHPSEPFFNFAPCQGGDFTIEPGQPYVSRYRVVTFDGRPDVPRIEAMWRDYVDPPVARVLK